MWIEVDHRVCTLKRATENERSWLSDYLSFPDDRAFFRKKGKWRSDGKVRMLNEALGTFPTGFLEAVVKAAKEDGIKLTCLDKRVPPAKPDPLALIDWLRDYQKDAIDAAMVHERGIFHHATGAGKTEIMVALAELYPVRWVILTHRKDLLVEIANRFARRTGEEVGMIGEGVWRPKRVTVATFHTVFSRVRRKATREKIAPFLLSVQGLMVDECHVTAANTFWRTTMAFPNAYFRYGFSGTPFARSDKKSIYTWGALGPVIHRISADFLIKAGVLARPKIRMTEVQELVKADTWLEVQQSAIVKSKIRNRAVLQAAKAAKKPCLLFVNMVEHGRLLELLLRSRGEKVEFVWGKKNLAVRQAAIRRLVHGDVDVLICNVIFQEGIDIPELQSVIVAQGGKSMIAALQRLGRGTRKRDSKGRVTKETFEVYDFADKGCGVCGRKIKGVKSQKHRSCKWLEKHTRARLRAYASEKFEVVIQKNLGLSK